MRFPLAFLCVLAAGCAAPPESSTSASSMSGTGGLGGADPCCTVGPSDVEAQEPDFTPSETVGEAREPQLLQMGLAFTCALAAYVLVKYGCDEGYYFTTVCPAGRYRIIQDVWDKSKSVLVSCDTIKTLVCGTSEITGAAALAKFCGHLTI